MLCHSLFSERLQIHQPYVHRKKQCTTLTAKAGIYWDESISHHYALYTAASNQWLNLYNIFQDLFRSAGYKRISWNTFSARLRASGATAWHPFRTLHRAWVAPNRAVAKCWRSQHERKRMVRPRGLEPPLVAQLAPQASASTNSAMAAACPRRERQGHRARTVGSSNKSPRG